LQSFREELATERSIGATDLRQRLTDVLQAVRERGETYIVEAFSRPQVAIINLDEYRRIQRFRQEREALFEWLETTAVRKLTLVSTNPRHPATCPEPFDKLRTGSVEGLSKESAVLAKQSAIEVVQAAGDAVRRQ